jgi:hypothetical protein
METPGSPTSFHNSSSMARVIEEKRGLNITGFDGNSGVLAITACGRSGVLRAVMPMSDLKPLLLEETVGLDSRLGLND